MPKGKTTKNDKVAQVQAAAWIMTQTLSDEYVLVFDDEGRDYVKFPALDIITALVRKFLETEAGKAAV